MDKRYQVFVSSTFADLQDERKSVIQTLMEIDCIPAGMELFPAADEEQFEFIKKVIDDCDYYLLIIGGRYGSVTEEGVSYTEKEFDYASDKGIKIIALIHGDLDSIPFGKTDANLQAQEKLKNFKEKVKTGRLVRFWKNASDLPGLVALSVTKTIKTHPGKGWVRADKIAKSSVLNNLAVAQAENKALLRQVAKLEEREVSIPQNLAVMSESFELKVNYMTSGSSRSASYKSSFEYNAIWQDIFKYLAPYLEEHPSEKGVSSTLGEIIRKLVGKSGRSGLVESDHLKTIGIQLEAYGLIQRRYSKTTTGGMGYFWSLSKAGKVKMMELRTVKAETP